MRIKDSYTYPAPLDRIGAMFADPEYTRSRLDIRGVVDPRVEVTEDGGVTTITVNASVDTDMLPAAARRFVRSGLSVSVVETWVPAQGTTRRGTTEVHVKGAPVTLRATSVLTGDSGTTTRTIDADLTVSIPLMGRRIEQQAQSHVHALFARELEAARTWLDAHPAD